MVYENADQPSLLEDDGTGQRYRRRSRPQHQTCDGETVTTDTLGAKKATHDYGGGELCYHTMEPTARER